MVDNSLGTTGDTSNNKLFKICQYIDLVTAGFESLYTLHQPVTTDEAIIPFKGHLGFKQYMKNEATKWGVKVFVLSDTTNGYIYWIKNYISRYNCECWFMFMGCHGINEWIKIQYTDR